MVLIRKSVLDIISTTVYILTQCRRFFRRHCEYVISKRKRNRTREVLRSKSSFMKNISISAPIGLFQHEPVLRQDKKREDPVTPQFQLHVPTPGVTRVNTSAVDGREDAERDEPITDARIFSSSPRSSNAPLPDGSPRSLNMVLSPDSEKPFSPFSSNANSFKAVEFAPSATMTPRLLQHPTLSSCRKLLFIFPLQLIPNPTADDRPYMRRRGTMISSAPPTIPGSPTSPTSHHSKYQGMGGFPGPAHLLQTVVRITAPHAYAHVERKLNRTMTMPTVTTIESTNVPWLKNLNTLVVGRNSDFQTEGLSDEELEDIGGAEYRALRLLSYLVPAVSRCLVFQSNSSI